MYLDDLKLEFDPLDSGVSADVGSKRIIARGRQYRQSADLCLCALARSSFGQVGEQRPG